MQFQGSSLNGTTPKNTIFRGGDPNRTAPINAFLGAVKSPSLETHHLHSRLDDHVFYPPENLFYPPLKMFSVGEKK
jgi:hypothetical protein